ncbi:MAG TPA: hypothetical protein VFG53_17180 [Anaeromyxobacter sp.]|nr:hypothetical protein [Anaeromyxobacter sp.]
MSAPAKRRLGELLVDAGIIDETQLKAALGHQRQWGIRLGQALVDLKLATEQDIVRILAKRFGFEVARLDQVEAYGHRQAVSLVPREFALKHNVFPLSADTTTLAVAMSDPTNLAVVDELRFRSGRRLKVTIGGDREIAAAVQAAYPNPDAGVEAIALDIDETGGVGEPVMGPFGGGSREDFESFFGADAAHSRGPPGVPEDPFGSGPMAAPVTVPVVHPGPLPAAAHTPVPAPVAPAAPVPVAPRAAPAMAARPAAAAPPTHNGPAPTTPSVKSGPASAAAPARRPPAPVRAAPPPARAGPAPAPPPARAGPAPAAPAPGLEELPSADAVRDARLQRESPAPAPVILELEEELGALPEDALTAVAPEGAEFTSGEQAILSALQRLAEGGHAEPDVVKPTQAIAVLIQILLRKGVVSERELLDALKKG